MGIWDKLKYRQICPHSTGAKLKGIPFITKIQFRSESKFEARVERNNEQRVGDVAYLLVT